MNMIYRETLKNGLRIVGETMENYRSVSVGRNNTSFIHTQSY